MLLGLLVVNCLCPFNSELECAPSCYTVVGPFEDVPLSYHSGGKNARAPGTHINRGMEGDGQRDGGTRQKMDEGKLGLNMTVIVSEVDK